MYVWKWMDGCIEIPTCLLTYDEPDRFTPSNPSTPPHHPHSSIDVLAVRLYLDRKVTVPYKSNACFGFDKATGWTFFDLTQLHDELKDSPVTVLEADFYHADQLLPQSDEALVARVKRYIAQCLPEVGAAQVTDYSVVRIPQGVTHFSPGSYQWMPGGHTVFPNLFMAGDWVVTRHGSFSQEKAYVTGLEAANAVMDALHGEGQGTLALALVGLGMWVGWSMDGGTLRIHVWHPPSITPTTQTPPQQNHRPPARGHHPRGGGRAACGGGAAAEQGAAHAPAQPPPLLQLPPPVAC